MDSKRWKTISSILAEALELEGAEREALLTEHCGDDAALRAEVDSLLATGATEGFLEESIAAIPRSLTTSASGLEVGERVGPYRLVRRVASGGMGQIWLGEHEDPEFARQVAIKVIRHGMDTEEILQRFRAERQILAQLDHPNIARLLDGGAMPGGTPYFVMEFIEGLPITEYCDERGLSIEARLKLFLEVCAAVHYAHRNLIVHRDLKPSNILVSPDAVPKLLDFGIAKVLDPDASDVPVAMTRTNVRVMTPEYASPEQVLGQPITTASDVYSLGVLLCELLTGGLPYRPGDKHSIERAICEEEPRRPSSVLSRADLSAADSRRIGHCRALAPERLERRLRGDLDNIVLMALRKAPDRRYASVQQLAEDLDRHLRGRPVAARSETVLYVVRKFVARNPVLVVIAFLVVTVLIAFTVVTEMQSRRIGTQAEQIREQLLAVQEQSARIKAQSEVVAEERDTTQEVTDFLIQLFEQADPSSALGKDLTVRAMLDRGYRRIESQLVDQPLVARRLMLVMARAYRGLDLYEPAVDMARRHLALTEEHFPGQPATIASARGDLGSYLAHWGHVGEAEPLLRQAVADLDAAGGDQIAVTGTYNQELAWLLESTGRLEEAERHDRIAVDVFSGFPMKSTSRAISLQHLGHAVYQQRRLDEAEALIEESHAELLRLVEPDDPHLAMSFAHRGKLRTARGDYAGAEKSLRQALEIRLEVYGERTVTVAMTQNEIAILLRRMGDNASAISMYEEAHATMLERLGGDHWFTVQASYNLGNALRVNGELDRAEPLLRHALEAGRKQRGENHPDVAHLSIPIIRVLLQRGDPQSAEPLARKAFEIHENTPPGGSARMRALEGLADTLSALERFAEAESLLTDEMDELERSGGGNAALNAALQDTLNRVREAESTP